MPPIEAMTPIRANWCTAETPEISPVFDGDVASELYDVRQNYAVANAAIVTDVHVRHYEAVRSHGRLKEWACRD